MVPDKWTVCVTCFTYNQSLYITETMDGFAMQQTSFPFVCCIVDDASTDGEQGIIKNYIFENFDLDEDASKRLDENDYGSYIVARHKNNQNCYFVALFLKKNHYGSQDLKLLKRSYISLWEKSSQYIALCEGDDYWIDPFKLQTQVDFLESHPDYSLCFHNVDYYNVSLNKKFLRDSNKSNDSIINTKEIIMGGGGYCPTCSIVYRLALMNNYPKFAKEYYVGDYPLQIYLSMQGKVYYFNSVMGVYRTNVPSSWTLKNNLSCKKAKDVEKIIDRSNKFLDNFDKYSNGQYHSVFLKRARRNKYDLYLEAQKYSKAIKYIPLDFYEILKFISGVTNIYPLMSKIKRFFYEKK